MKLIWATATPGLAATTPKLDEHNQSPLDHVGELSPTLLIEESSDRPGFYKTPEYLLLGEFSRFGRPAGQENRVVEGFKLHGDACVFPEP